MWKILALGFNSTTSYPPIDYPTILNQSRGCRTQYDNWWGITVPTLLVFVL